MEKCTHSKKCFEPVFKDGLCQEHFDHEQRISAHESRVLVRMTEHGAGGGVLRDIEGNLKSPTPKRSPRRPKKTEIVVAPTDKDALVGALSSPLRTCSVPRCGQHYPSDNNKNDLGLCKACKSLYRIWHRHTVANLVSPVTPSAEQLAIFQRIQPPCPP